MTKSSDRHEASVKHTTGNGRKKYAKDAFPIFIIFNVNINVQFWFIDKYHYFVENYDIKFVQILKYFNIYIKSNILYI